MTDAQPAWQRGKNRTRGDLPWLGARCRDDCGQSTRPREGPARWPQSRPGPSLQGSECHHRDGEMIRMPPEVSFLFFLTESRPEPSLQGSEYLQRDDERARTLLGFLSFLFEVILLACSCFPVLLVSVVQ